MGFKESDQYRLIETGEWFTRQNMADGPFRNNILEVFEMLRKLIPSGVLSPHDHIMLTFELFLAFTDAVGGEDINKLIEAERSVRAKVELLLGSLESPKGQ